MTYWAHSGSSTDRTDWQLLPDHLHAVARLAGDMASELGLGKAAHLAGLFHDLGKYDPAFDHVLKGEKVRVDHSTAGAAVLLERAQGRGRQIAELIAYGVLGHHAGLPDKTSAADSCLSERIARFENRLDPVWEADVAADFTGIGEEFLSKARKEDAAFDLSVAVRMLFSCLVDADFKDTEGFYAKLGGGPRPDRSWPALQDILPDLASAFGAHMSGRPREGELNALRRDILTHVREKAAMPPGLFTLTAPTGGGKTLASLGFALDHSRRHGRSRIIYAIPFTSIIDQTAAIFREVLGEGVVLEHHSAIDEERGDAGRGRAGRDKLKLAMEDWAAPIVVTTNVQLFESLFAARPSRVRKLHNIAGSVIILDEAQTIPRPLLMPCVRMLDTLAAHWGCTIVLCTATQPPLAGRELAPDPQALAARLRRATIRWGGAMDDAALIEALRREPQALVIVNSSKHALELYRGAQEEGLDDLIHLTTRQYAADRKRVLADVRTRLKNLEPCRLIATSLIEAGVDVDFPRVWRAEAGLDQIVQAAGRCNREGRRPIEESVVNVFEAPDHPPPAEIAGLIGDTRRMLGGHDDLLSLPAMQAYFEEVYWRMGERLDEKRVRARLGVSRFGSDFAFRSIAEDFRMIESGMVPVIVAREEAAQEAVGRLQQAHVSSGAIARALQPFVVQAPPMAREKLRANGHAAFVRPDIRGDQFMVLKTDSLYHEDTGLLWEDTDYLAQDTSII